MKASSLGKLTGAAIVLCIFGMAPQQASSAVILNGCIGGSFGNACGLDELLGGGSIIVGDTRFSNFTLDNFFGQALDPSLIRVDPISTFLNPGFTLVDTGNTLHVANGDFSGSNFNFDVTVVSGDLRIKDNSLAITVGGITGGSSSNNVFVDEILLDQGLVNTLSNVFVSCDAGSTPVCPAGTSSSATFSSLKGVSALTEIDVFSDTGGTADIDTVTFQFSQVPEPGSFGLFALGLAGMGFMSRKLRKEAI